MDSRSPSVRIAANLGLPIRAGLDFATLTAIHYFVCQGKLFVCVKAQGPPARSWRDF